MILPGGPVDVMGVVTEVDYVKQTIALVTTETSKTRAQASILFAEMRCKSDQIQELCLVTHQTDRDYLNSLAICRDCRRVFHVLSCDTPPEDVQLEVALLQAQVAALFAHKQQMIRIRQYEAVLTCTTHIKELKTQIQLAKRKLEFVDVVLCPYCGWCVS